MSAAVIVSQQNRAIRRFRAAAATDASNAVRPGDVHVRDNWVFRRMVARGVFVAAAGDAYFLDESAARRFAQRRGKIALVMCGVAVVIVIWIMVR